MWLATWAAHSRVRRITELTPLLWINHHPDPWVLSLRWYVHLFLQTSYEKQLPSESGLNLTSAYSGHLFNQMNVRCILGCSLRTNHSSKPILFSALDEPVHQIIELVKLCIYIYWWRIYNITDIQKHNRKNIILYMEIKTEYILLPHFKTLRLILEL